MTWTCKFVKTFVISLGEYRTDLKLIKSVTNSFKKRMKLHFRFNKNYTCLIQLRTKEFFINSVNICKPI